MTIRPRFPTIYRLIGACRRQASRNCQDIPAGASRMRPKPSLKCLIKRIFFGNEIDSDAISSRILPDHRENTGWSASLLRCQKCIASGDASAVESADAKISRGRKS